MDKFETFGQLIRMHRQARGETLAELAENLTPYLPDQDAGISVAMLSRIETDDRMPSAKVASALADYYGMPVDETIALLAIAKTTRGWRSAPVVESDRRFAASDSRSQRSTTETATFESTPQGQTVREQRGRDAIREAAAKVRGASPLAGASSAASHGGAAGVRNLEDMIMAAELTIQMLERTASGVGLTPTQRHRLSQRVASLADRLSRAFDPR